MVEIYKDSTSPMPSQQIVDSGNEGHQRSRQIADTGADAGRLLNDAPGVGAVQGTVILMSERKAEPHGYL